MTRPIHFAGMWRRFVGFLLDALAVASLVCGALSFPASDLTLAAAWVVPLVYYLGLEMVFGRTIGKLLTRTKVVDADGGKPMLRQIFARTLLRLIPAEAAFIVFGRPTTVHDLLSDTRVVTTRTPGTPT